jgi:hypothetical protein
MKIKFRMLIQPILEAAKRVVARGRVTLRFGNVFLLGSLAIIRRSQLTQLYNRIAMLEWFSAAGGPSKRQASSTPAATQRSAVFLHNSYYNFHYLAAALRKRGWDALSVSVEDPDGEHARFYHGNDLCLYDSSEDRMRENLEEFFDESIGRFRMAHFYGRGQMSFFPSEFDLVEPFSSLPMDFIRFKRSGGKIGYSVCGCLDGVSQSTFHRWSQGCCDRCVWQNNPVVCNDKGNLAWGHKVEMFCDLIACEGFAALDYQSGQKAYREPLTTALDHQFWRPDLEIPAHLRLSRSDGELIVYHAVGNFDLRSTTEKNVKGTRAVSEAVARLKSEGMNVRLEFVTDMISTDVRFIQSQSDVVVDQLNHGRYGANAREAMMLGRPTICYINKSELPGQVALESIETCPLVSANETTLYTVLRDLLLDRKKRRDVGDASRKYALKWHSADACAERFEQIYDRLMMNLPPSSN